MQFDPISAGGGALCLAVAAVLMFAMDGAFPRITVGFIVAGMSGVLVGSVGKGLHKVITWANDHLGHLLDKWVGVGASLAALVILGVFPFVRAAMKVWNASIENVDPATIVTIAVVPATVSLVPGPIGSVLQNAVAGVAWVFGQTALQAFGQVKGWF